MSPLLQKLIEAAIAIALTAAIVGAIVIINSLLMSRGSSFHGFRLWLAFITRPDILGTMILTALVSVGYGMWQQGRRLR